MLTAGQKRPGWVEEGKRRRGRDTDSSQNYQTGHGGHTPTPPAPLWAAGKRTGMMRQKKTACKTTAWAHIPILPLKSYVVWANFFTLSELQFSQL